MMRRQKKEDDIESREDIKDIHKLKRKHTTLGIVENTTFDRDEYISEKDNRVDHFFFFPLI